MTKRAPEVGTMVIVPKGTTLFEAKTGQPARPRMRHRELGAAEEQLVAMFIGTAKKGELWILRRLDLSFVAVEASKVKL